jgi:glycosyltransferase involved in cell wall biosynthesis
MKICVWFKTTEGPWGGGNSFLRSLCSQLKKIGHEVVDTPQSGVDVVLVNSWTTGATERFLSPGQVAAVKAFGKGPSWTRRLPPSIFRPLGRRGPAIVHRVDGVAELYRGKGGIADRTQFAINPLADVTVFQSKYCRESFSQYNVRPDGQCVIHNATDPSVFYPSERLAKPTKILHLLSTSWSSNPRKGFATIAQLSEVPNTEIRFVGQWAPEIEPKKVKLLGVMEARQIADQLRQSDALVHAAQNEPSSNTIMEALSCGLPVLYLDSGANKELAGDYGVELTDDLAWSVEDLRSQFISLRDRTLRDRSEFLIQTATDRYVEAFEQAVNIRDAG